MGVFLVTMFTVFFIYWLMCYVGTQQDPTDRLDYYFNLDDEEDENND